MDALARFEGLIESVVEGSLAEITTGHLQPVEIAKKLARAMDSGQTMAADRTLAPNDYQVKLNGADYSVFAPFRVSLERELAAYVRALGRERGLSFVTPPRVALVEDATLRPRRVRITASLSDAIAANGAVVAGELTAPLPIAQVRETLTRAASLVMADGRRIPLDKPVISLGRHLDNSIVVEDKRVSRHHAQIRYEHRNYLLSDLSSANGTTVNGQAIEHVILRDGDRVSLGGVEMTFHRLMRETRRGA